MRNFLSFIWETLKIVIIALVIVIPIRYFLFQPFFIKGASMEPNFDDGQYLIIDELSYRFREPQRGEIVVFKYPHDPSQRYIKRIIGLPGETVEVKDGRVFISGEALDESGYLPTGTLTPGLAKITLAENDYFVLGDNRLHSSDSRSWGPLPKENIVGRAYLRAWPFDVLAKFEAPTYSSSSY
jgi:signal peptidase I